MNSYSGVNPKIITLVQKYAKQLEKSVSGKISAEDFEQQLMLNVIIALKKYEVREGSLFSFINRVLFLTKKDITRYLWRDRRKTNLFEVPYNSLTKTSNSENYMQKQIDINSDLDLLPKNLKLYLKKLKQLSKIELRKILHPPGLEILLIKKILSKTNKMRNRKLKNIACIETLSVREISQLSETDLFDLFSKINETCDWIKQLKEKFELALQTKYENEAQKNLNEDNKDFGSTKLTKGNFSVSVEIPKKVQWDQKLLANIYSKMDPEARSEIFKVTYSIGEREYSKLTDTVREAIAPARTTCYGKLKITISKEGE